MGKVSFNLPICGGRGQPNDTEDQRLKPYLHEDDDLPDYSKFPYSTFFPEDHKGKGKSEDPVLDKSSPQYRERVKKTLDALQDEYQETYEWYKDANCKVLSAREERDQLLWNLAVLDIRNVAGQFESSMDSIHEDVGKIQREVRDQNKPSKPTSEYSRLRCNRGIARRCLYRIEIALEAGLRELARLDGADSDAFRQLRGMWARRQSRHADDESLYSETWSATTYVIDD
ncbi:hypothetical protein NW755_002832 [Fusarium falciforme]|uniref:Uncharacterized protein n=1 Tax=Fusarium falciforme TaxID=195108 RepID=A0A9W8RC06_9HYPO|nr:hypothetical protein NW755_002832 [Fusarium falciforme]KAJ4247308.1 hypothetical protein NW757_008946 [Fusarium falciforme]